MVKKRPKWSKISKQPLFGLPNLSFIKNNKKSYHCNAFERVPKSPQSALRYNFQYIDD